MSCNAKFRWFLLIPIFIALLVVTSEANELWFFSGSNSKNSKIWQDEVLNEYAKSELGKTIPAKIITVQGDIFPKWFLNVMQEGRVGEIRGTPTFIIWDDVNKKEVGRIEGYTNKSRFYSQLNQILVSSSQEGGSGSKQQREGSGGMSRDILMDHIYKTPGEARRASNMLGLGGVIHSHETPQGVIYMPGSVSPSRQNLKEVDRLARERRLLEEERKKLEAAEERQRQAQAKKKPTPQSGTGSGFFVSKMGHVITNAHVVQNCKKVTIGDNVNKQVPAELINTDRSNDLALLKLSTLEMASAESKSLIQKLGITVVPLASKGLLRNEDVKLGEKVLVAGYPFGDTFSNTIKVTTGVVSATRGAGDNSGQFQLDAAVQPGNSGGPIYDSGGNIVGVVVAQLNKRTFGSFVENMNFGIKASTVRQFLVASGINSKKSERTEEKSTEQLAEIAKNQALMVMCLQ